MPRETNENSGVMPTRLTELHDVATPGTRPADLAKLHFRRGATTADDDFETVEPSAAIPNVAAAPTMADHNAVLAALRAHGIILP